MSRTYNACLGCRRRKSKCDSMMPVCGHCLRRGEECVYIPRKKTRTRAKVKELEDLKIQNTLLKRELLTPSASVTPTESLPLRSPAVDQEVLGETVSEVVRAAYINVTSVCGMFTSSSEFQQAFRAFSLIEFNHILGLYWKYQNVNVMALWKRIVCEDLLSPNPGEFSSKSLVMAVLAAGTTFTLNHSLRSKGHIAYKVAKCFLAEERWSPTVTTPQTMCLLCMYENYLGDKRNELHYSKAALKCCVELGLNRFNPGALYSKEMDSVRRFTWWSCYQVDMLVRTSVKQAPFSSKDMSGVNPPQVSPEMYIESLLGEDEDSYREFIFLSTITLDLCVILGETLRTAYARWTTVTQDERKAMIETCIAELQALWDSAQHNPAERSPQSFTFKLRFIYAKILLCGFFIEPQMLEPDKYEMEGIRDCVSLAENLLLVYEEFDKAYGVWTLERFSTDFPSHGLEVMLCALKFDCNNVSRERKLLEHCHRFIKIMLTGTSVERYKSNLKTIRDLLTEWDCDLSPMF